MRYLGLDIGQKNIGVAVGETLARELTTIRAGKSESFYDKPTGAYEQIDKIMANEAIEAVIIGLPVDQEGKPTEESVKIEKFGRGLAKTTGKPVQYVNETLTSFMAKDILESQEVTGRAAEERLDQLSAELILQQYLEEHALV